MTSVSYLALGSNIETTTASRFDHLHSAVRQFAQFESVDIEQASHVYETKPVGYEDQENFYNAIVKISTTLSPQELLRVSIDVVEKRAGRIRTVANGPRTLDVDILTYDDLEIDESGLTIPHPRMKDRAFVMVPLAEIAPEIVGDLAQYSFVDSVNEVIKTEFTFDDIIESYRER